MHYIKKLFITVSSLSVVHGGVAQIPSADPAGYVTKYNPRFDGTGPRVYILPAPRTAEEILIDRYAEKRAFADTIARAFSFQKVLADFRFTSNAPFIRQFYKPMPSTSEEWNKIINQEKSLGNIPLTMGLLNEYAWESLNNHNITQAIGVLIGALNMSSENSTDSDFAVLQQNLANIYVLNRNYSEAATLQERSLASASRKRSVVDQAHSWVKIALVQAHQKDFVTAENSIIRKAIPLYNRARDYSSKVIAWQQLAGIYQMHGKHTEAQWFLIQARDLAESKSFNGQRAEIEYMLAVSKLAQKNYKIAIKEFENARKMAQRDNNQLLELAILDKLGETYIATARYQDAEDQLDLYWRLRNKLFHSSADS